MTDKFISPCSQPELLEAMAKAHHEKEIAFIDTESTKPAFEAYQWENLPKAAREAKIENMAAALEALRDPPEEFLEAMVVRVYRKLNMCSEKETMQAALIAAINQTLKDES